MASIVLGTLGKAAFGKIGGALGAYAGSQIDNLWQSNLSNAASPISKLGNLRIQASQNGAPIPKIFGRARISGQVIWADEFKQTTIKRTIGGKGGKKTKEYVYSISFAIGLCEGQIAKIGRVWANGEIIDLNQYEYRFYNGDNISPDPLIEAKLGIDNCPYYKNLAYIVFENMPLETFGDRIPQLSFELFAKNQNDNSLENLINGVCLIPASGEFSLATTPIIEKIGKANEIYINNHNDEIKTDFVSAIENLENELPNSKAVSLVVSWFGTDINAQNCQIIPKVENHTKITSPRSWKVAGLNRQNANLISKINGNNAYGGTIDDAAVIEAIKHLNSKGFSVCFNPFIMMDCENYPWRGRISLAANLNATNNIIAPINNFYGNVNASHFSIQNEEVIYSGPNEWSYSRFVLHYAALCKAAGGVESFLIGSELIGLTRLFDADYNFHFVDKLIELASEVRAILGSATKISYAADWTEYGAYYVANGNNLFFPCDKLWANNNIDFIGIDYYAPISDIDDNQNPSQIDLQNNIEGGENYDYYYQNETARINRQKTPIIDNIYQENWVYRQKDLRGFWNNYHYSRFNGMKLTNPTSWMPQSKPIRLMELGYPAIDKGGNRPSVFPDAKSIENGIPPFSNGLRDDNVMRNCLNAFLSYWQGENNPVSIIYNDKMIDMEKTHIWAWDARPFPQFPNLSQIWSDGVNYDKGHWLMGRVNNANLEAVFDYCLKNIGITNYKLENLNIAFDGFIIEQNESARKIIEFLMIAFAVKYRFENGQLIFFIGNKNQKTLDFDNLHINENDEIISRNFENETNAKGISLKFYSEDKDYEIYEIQYGDINNKINISAPLIANSKQIEKICENISHSQIMNNEEIQISIGLKHSFDLQIGDNLNFINGENYSIENIEIGNDLQLNLRKASKVQNNNLIISPPKNGDIPIYFGKGLAFVLDLPAPFVDIKNPKPKLFFACANFIPNIGLFFEDEEIANINKCAKIGFLKEDYLASSIAFISKKPIIVEMRFGQILDNNGRAAIVKDNKIIEIIEYSNAQMIGANLYEINNIIRSLNGSQKSKTLPQDADFVLLDDAGQFINLADNYWNNEIICKLKSPSNYNNNSHDLKLNFGAIAQIPWATSHIFAKRENQGIKINFNKRNNEAQNSWENYKINSSSNYEIKILDLNNNLKRTLFSTETSVFYNQELQDFGQLQNFIMLEICEINEFGQKGHEAQSIVQI